MAKKIHIPEPCHEDWSEMTAVRHDCRHCSICEISVVDFTQKTDAEILEILRQSPRKVCGKFRQDQLERPLLASPPAIRPYKTNKSWSIAASVAALLSVQQAAAQQPVAPIATERTPSPSRDILGGVQYYDFLEHDSMRTISGKIIHRKSRKPIPDCLVSLDGDYKTRVKTDENGLFSIEIPKEEFDKKNLKLKLKLWGYEPQDVAIPERAKSEDIAIAPIRYKLKKQKLVVMGCPAFMP